MKPWPAPSVGIASRRRRLKGARRLDPDERSDRPPEVEVMEMPARYTRLLAAVAAAFLASSTVGRAQAPSSRSARASVLPMPKYHHIHLNSANPNTSLD